MAFLKVKRKCEEDPKEVLVLAHKKCKLQETSDQISIFELASSAVQEKDVDDAIIKTVKYHGVKSPKCDLEKLKTRMREDHKERNKRSRYKLYTATRKLDDADPDLSVSVIDVLNGDDATQNEEQNEYVYDIYYSSSNVDVMDPDFTEKHILHDVQDDYDWDHQFESENECDAPDEDDSNDENNWRNDYPEEESSEDTSPIEDDDYLSKEMSKMRIPSDHSLSSSDFEYHYCDEDYEYYGEIASDDNDEY